MNDDEAQNDEVWKMIDGYSRYEVSTFGRVKNKDGVIMKTTPQNAGYIRIKMVNDIGTKKNVRVHRLVCLAFLENPWNKPTVNHKDHNKWNNHISNLEWATIPEQNAHRTIVKSTYNHLEKAPMDTWVQIPKEFINTETPYYISANGKVKNKMGYISKGYCKDGYISVTISSKKYPLHILMAKVFLPNVDNKPYVNHKDGNKENAKLSNLEWCTPSENSQHALKMNLLQYCKPIKVCDLHKNTITTYASIRQAQLHLKTSCKTIKKYSSTSVVYKKRYIFQF